MPGPAWPAPPAASPGGGWFQRLLGLTCILSASLSPSLSLPLSLGTVKGLCKYLLTLLCRQELPLGCGSTGIRLWQRCSHAPCHTHGLPVRKQGGPWADKETQEVWAQDCGCGSIIREGFCGFLRERELWLDHSTRWLCSARLFPLSWLAP